MRFITALALFVVVAFASPVPNADSQADISDNIIEPKLAVSKQP
ncbi:hypothetical protein PT974_04824 [Cladobotryum mycophilum]|uniref:Uncharacterized protein n=1 Tax=Cladobotryum mycophilum TaxID=491253 RepID=A0ABR0SRJ4_9HYPO